MAERRFGHGQVKRGFVGVWWNKIGGIGVRLNVVLKTKQYLEFEIEEIENESIENQI